MMPSYAQCLQKLQISDLALSWLVCGKVFGAAGMEAELIHASAILDLKMLQTSCDGLTLRSCLLNDALRNCLWNFAQSEGAKATKVKKATQRQQAKSKK